MEIKNPNAKTTWEALGLAKERAAEVISLAIAWTMYMALDSMRNEKTIAKNWMFQKVTQLFSDVNEKFLATIFVVETYKDLSFPIPISPLDEIIETIDNELTAGDHKWEEEGIITLLRSRLEPIIVQILDSHCGDKTEVEEHAVAAENN